MTTQEQVKEAPMALNAIASYCICHTASINIYEIDYGTDGRVLAGLNDREPEWCTIHCHVGENEQDTDDGRMYFLYGEYKVFLDECMRTNL